MLNIPVFTRAFAMMLISLGIYLAFENTLISADVLASATGASIVASTAIAITATGLELIFASWLRQGDTLTDLWSKLRSEPSKAFVRLFLAGMGLGLVYHFDIVTTALHPGFSTQSTYFFAVVIAAFVFGPEVCIVLSSWLWEQARDTETRQLATGNTKTAENAYRRAERARLVKLAAIAGKDDATKKAAQRWG